MTTHISCSGLMATLSIIQFHSLLYMISILGHSILLIRTANLVSFKISQSRIHSTIQMLILKDSCISKAYKIYFWLMINLITLMKGLPLFVVWWSMSGYRHVILNNFIALTSQMVCIICTSLDQDNRLLLNLVIQPIQLLYRQGSVDSLEQNFQMVQLWSKTLQ